MRSGYVLLGLLVACSGGGQHLADATNDTIAVGCGDGVKGSTEACDGADLGSATCASAAEPGWVGILSCTQTCQLDIAACNPPATTWSTLTDPTNWSTFDVGTLYPGAKGFTSSAFDGRYLYLIPSNNGAPDGIVARYDTQGGFGASDAWSTFDVSTVDGAAKGFAGAAFDGHYIYLVPYNNGAYDGTIARYDTQAAGGFGASASWATFDITTFDPNAKGFQRAAFDGRYLYLSPYYNGMYDGTVARYDTQGAGLTMASSWSTFDVSTVNPGSRGFLGITFDGRYIYFVPYYNNTVYDGVVTRYDTQATGGFGAAASWSTFDLATINPNAVGFYGTAFDGRYVYFSQYYNGAAAVPDYAGLIARYDTQAEFGSPGSWTTFDVATLNPGARGFIGAAFDGRYVFLVPYYDDAYDGIIARYDTQAQPSAFGSAASWSLFDLSTLNAGATGYQGAGFDGQYIYLVPTYNGVYSGLVARFNAKTPSWLPKDWYGAFD